MHATAVSLQSVRLPSPALRRFAWGVLVYFIAVILWGTLVRATGSGGGCGNHWPLCNGTVMQHSASVNTMIEFTHRLTSGLSFFFVVGLVAWTFAGTARGHLARAAAVASVAFTLIEATLGALLVKLGLTAQSQSPLRPAYLALHLTNTLLLVAALTLTAHLLSRTKGYLRGGIRLAAPFGAVATVVVVMIVGVTGSLAALGDTLFPATLAGPGAGAGLLLDQRLAGALALDAPHRGIRGQHLPHLASGARRAAIDRLGQSRPLRAGAVPAGRGLWAWFARCLSVGSAVGPGGAPAGSRYAVGRAGGADGEADAAASRIGVAVAGQSKRIARSG